MTYEEAVEFTRFNIDVRCEYCIYSDECKNSGSVLCTEWEKLVVGALEKQIPKKPSKYTYGRIGNSNEVAKIKGLFCPNCGAVLGREVRYIGVCQCGQKLAKWSDEECQEE